MTELRDRDDIRAFEAHLRVWGARAPTTPPHAAGAAVVARLSRWPRRALAFRLATAVAAVALALSGVLIARHGSPRSTPSAEPLASIHPLPDNVVQFWLDAETPVYFVMGPERPNQGGS